jgi:maleylpyruvate isomerase
MTEPVLYGYFRSSAAWRVRIAMSLKGVKHQRAFRHLRKGEQRSADYLAVNPEGLVPALVLAGGEALTQSMAIIELLEETWPEPPLLPPDALGRARVRALAQAVACDIHPLNNLRVLRRLKSQFGADEAALDEWARHWIATGFQGLEARLAKEPATGAFCHGATPSLADICLVPQVGSARRFGLDLEPYPTIRRIDAACGELPAFTKARPENQPDAEE